MVATRTIFFSMIDEQFLYIIDFLLCSTILFIRRRTVNNKIVVSIKLLYKVNFKMKDVQIGISPVKLT